MPGGVEVEFTPPQGDMLKSVYDTDDDGVVDNSEKLEGSTKAEILAQAMLWAIVFGD